MGWTMAHGSARMTLTAKVTAGAPVETLLNQGDELILRERKITPSRRLVGNYITALEMQGASISVLKLDDEMVELWDTPVWTPALRWGV